MYSTKTENNFPSEMIIKWKNTEIKLCKSSIDLRYGTNPNQTAAYYTIKNSLWSNLKMIKSGKGGPSQTNLEDVDRALKVIKYFDNSACVVMKHLMPSGIAMREKNEKTTEIYESARDCDSQAAFGSVIVFNEPITKETAEEITQTYVEVVAAPDYLNCLPIFEKKKNIRLLKYDIQDLKSESKYVGQKIRKEDIEIKMLTGGSMILADPFLTRIKNIEDLNIVTKKKINQNECKDLIFSWYSSFGTRSNGIILSKNLKTIGIACGQQDRVTAVKLAIEKALYTGKTLSNSVLASDGFFPFRDSVDLIAKHGIKAIIQPGGSIKDQEVIDACNEYGISMAFTNERCFGHF